MSAADEQIIKNAESLLVSRLDLVRPLAEISAERKSMQARMDDIDKRYGAAYANAEAGGWTVAELRQMGATEPTKRPPGRPKKVRTVKAASSGTTPVSAPNPRAPESEQTPTSAPST